MAVASGLVGAAWGFASSAWAGVTAAVGAVVSHGAKLIENGYKLVSSSIENGLDAWSRIFDAQSSSSVFDLIEPGTEFYSGTYIPKEFSLTINGNTLTVISQGTKHFKGYLNPNKYGSLASTQLVNEYMMESFHKALTQVVQTGYEYGVVQTVNGWEIGISQGRVIPTDVITMYDIS